MLNEAIPRAARVPPQTDDEDASLRASSAGGNSDSWRTLMLAAQQGDDVAYDTLMREVSVWLHRYYQRRLPTAAAEDAAQEVLLAIHCRRYTYTDSGPFGPWLSAIARHKWTDSLRQRSRDPLPLEDHRVTVEDHGVSVRAAVLLEGLMATLKPAQAQVIRLVKLNGSSIQEAADATGQSPSLVKVNIHRGLKRVAQDTLPDDADLR